MSCNGAATRAPVGANKVECLLLTDEDILYLKEYRQLLSQGKRQLISQGMKTQAGLTLRPIHFYVKLLH